MVIGYRVGGYTNDELKVLKISVPRAYPQKGYRVGTFLRTGTSRRLVLRGCRIAGRHTRTAVGRSVRFRIADRAAGFGGIHTLGSLAFFAHKFARCAPDTALPHMTVRADLRIDRVPLEYLCERQSEYEQRHRPDGNYEYDPISHHRYDCFGIYTPFGKGMMQSPYKIINL